LYSPSEEPDDDDDWLLDIRLYSRSFRADRASIILDELGLEHHHLRDHLSQRRSFFDNKERLQKLKTLVASTDTAADLDRKMLAVVVKAEQPELFTILRTLFHAWTDVEDADDIDLSTAPPCWAQIEKFDLAQPFWQCIQTTFGYHEEAPSLRNLLIRLLVTDYAVPLHGDVPQSLAHLLLPRTGHANAVRGETTIQPVTVHVLGTSHKITAPRHRFALLQMEPVSARVTPITLKVAVYERDEPVTNVETVTFDSTSGQMDERQKWVSLVLRDRPYDKTTRYRLVLRDANTGIEQSSVDVTIDRAFADDF